MIKSWLIISVTGLMLALSTACGGSEKSGSSETVTFYAGSSNGKLEHSIFLCELDPVSLDLSVIDSFPGIKGSGYLDLSPDGLTLFATSGVSVPNDEGHNSVASYRVNPADHSMELINRQSSRAPVSLFAMRRV